ncbi:hypothetical protein SLA2020_492320 [Shorea laevis]
MQSKECSLLYRNPLPPSYQNNLWLKRQASIPLVLLCPTMTLCAATSRAGTSSPTALPAKPRFSTYCTSCDH